MLVYPWESMKDYRDNGSAADYEAWQRWMLGMMRRECDDDSTCGIEENKNCDSCLTTMGWDGIDTPTRRGIYDSIQEIFRYQLMSQNPRNPVRRNEG